jgi:DNA-binding CsgD family transcriptional regulator
MVPRTHAELLGARGLTRVLNLLEDCGQARDLGGFRETVVESLGSNFGYRHVTFFLGTTVADLFADRAPVINGVPHHVVDAYVEHAHRDDPFARYAALHGYRRERAITLDHLDPQGLPGSREYLDSFLFRSGIYGKLVIFLRANGFAGGIGVLARESGTFGNRDLALAQVLSAHLENLFRLTSQTSATTPAHRKRLSPRQTEVTELVARGLTNQQIADALSITTDTVKKHVASAREATGCSNRTQLALTWQRQKNQARPEE